MRFLSIFVLFSIVSLSACGGSPIGPTTVVPPVPGGPGNAPTRPAQPQPPPTAPLAISPSSVTMTVGQEVIFTVSGGDGLVYSYIPVQPGYSFETNQIGHNQFRVRMFTRSDISPTVFSVDGSVGGQIRAVSALITVR